MSQALPDYQTVIESLITEDDEPVDNIPSARQQRLLTETLYSSWHGPGAGRTFLAEASIGVFYLMKNPAIVPDVLLSLDVEVHPDFRAKEHRSYFLWEFGKPPDVVIEIVSNREGGEDEEKLRKYERMKIGYYVIFDPEQLLSDETLRIFRLEGFSYDRYESTMLPEIHPGLTLWEGEFEGLHSTWLRWTDKQGRIIPTGKERAAQEQQRAEKLAARLRELGHERRSEPTEKP